MQHVFISYSHKDNDFAQLLRTELQKAGIQTWLALENISAGEDWKEEIDDAIKNSFALVVIISPSSDQSKYVAYEWALAYGFGIPIIPILYKRLELPQKLHPRLESLQYEDFTANTNRPWDRITERLTEIHTQLISKEKLDPKIVEAIQALDSWDSSTIVRAAKMLGQRKIQSAIPKLDKLLDEPDPEIQIAALEALDRIGSSQAIDKIISLVNTKNETKFAAIETLGKIGDVSAEKILLQQINSDDHRTKIVSISAMQNIPSSSFKEVLLELLQNFTYDPEDVEWSEWNGDAVLSSALNALSKLVTKNDTPNLLNLLKKEDVSLLSGVVELLGELCDESALASILGLTRSKSSKVSKAASLALKKFESIADFQKKLEQLSVDREDGYEDPIKFFYQFFGLEGLLYALAHPKSKAYWNITNKIEEVVKDSDIDRLLEALQDSENRVRGLIAEVIRRKRFTKACNNLKLLVDDESPFVRGLAIRAVGDLQCTRSIRILKEKLKDDDRIFSNSSDEVRDFAAIALAKFKHKDALPRLRELVSNEKSSLQEESLDLFIALGDVGDNKSLLSELYGNEPMSRIIAFRILCSLEKKIDVNELITALGLDDNKVRENAIDQLSNLYAPLGLIVALTLSNVKSYWEVAAKLTATLQPEHSSLIIQLLSDKHYRVRAFLADALSSRPDLNLGEHLVPLIDDDAEFVRGLTIRALGNLKYEPAKLNLISRLNDTQKIYSNSDVRVCDYSAIALVKIEGKVLENILENLKVNPSYISRELIEINQASRLVIEAKFINELPKILLGSEIDENSSRNIIDLIGEFGSAGDAHFLLDYLALGRGEWYSIDSIVNKIADETIKTKASSLLSIKNNGLRMTCLNILEVYGDKTIIAEVLSLLDEEEDGYVIFRAINILAAYGDISLLDRVSSFADSEDEHVRASVLRFYGKIREENSVSKILPFFNDKAYIVRAAAVQALIDVGDPKNLSVILDEVDLWYEEKGDHFVFEYQLSCVKAIGRFGNGEHISLLRDISLKHKHSDCRVAAIYALKELDSEKNIDFFIDKLSDKDYAYEYEDSVCNIAARILKTINKKEARTALEEWLSSLPEDERPDLTRD